MKEKDLSDSVCRKAVHVYATSDIERVGFTVFCDREIGHKGDHLCKMWGYNPHLKSRTSVVSITWNEEV